MHIHKLFAVMSVAAIAGAGSLKAQNADTEAQAKAREALRQTISQLKTGATNVTPAPATPVPVAPPSEPAPTPGPALAPAPADAAAPAAAVAPANQLTPEQEQQLLQQERDLVRGHTQPPATVNAAATPADATPAAVPALAPAPATLPQSSENATGTPVPAGSDLTPAQQDELVRQERELIYNRNKATVVDSNAGWPKAEYPAQMANTNISMISGSKQQKLDQLLQLYRDDMITPLQYHQQRAKIIEEP